MRMYPLYGFIGLLLLLGSCKSLDTDLSIATPRMPEHFGPRGESGGPDLADMDWRDYFGDKNLIALIDTALVGNLDLHMALQRIEIARSEVGFALGESRPKVEGSLSVGLDRYARYTPDHAGNSTTEYLPGEIVPDPLPDLFVGLTSTWEVDLWGKLRKGRKAALSRFLASVEGKNLVVSNLVAEVALSYYGLLSLDRELEILEGTLDRQQASLDFVLALKEVGKANELAVQQFSAQRLHTEVLKKGTLQKISVVENRINFLLGRYPQPLPREKRNLEQGLHGAMEPGIPALLLSRRPDIRMAEQRVLASKFDLEAAKAAFFPSLDLVAGLGFQAFKPQFLFRGSESIGYSALGNLVAPLVNRKALKAAFNSAKADQLEAMYEYQKTLLGAYVEVVNELQGMERLEEIHALREQQTDILGNSIETSIELYRSAKAGYLEIMVAQHGLLEAQLDLIRLNFERQRATINVYKALGGGWQEVR